MGKRRSLKVISKAPPDFTTERGTHMYAYNFYKANVLTALLNDLIVLENLGLNEDNCRLVCQSLGNFVNATTEIPKGRFMTGTLSKEVEEFEELYRKWNDIHGRNEEAIEQRRKILKKLRRSRQAITDKVRNLHVEMFLGLDRTILISTYKALADLIQSAPNIFKNLATAVADYNKRGALA